MAAMTLLLTLLLLTPSAVAAQPASGGGRAKLKPTAPYLAVVEPK